MPDETTHVDDTTAPEETQSNPDETKTEDTVQTQDPDADKDVDYKAKFTDSFKEVMKTKQTLEQKEEEIAARDLEIERLRKIAEEGDGTSHSGDTEVNFPGFSELDEVQQAEIIKFAKGIESKVKGEILSDPALVQARETFNERKWDNAFSELTADFPELADKKGDFKAKYYNSRNVPDNIKNILGTLAKSFLYDSAKEAGKKEAQEEIKETADRIEIERTGGGDKKPATSRTLEDWSKLQQTNPAEFARRSKEYNADLASGNL